MSHLIIALRHRPDLRDAAADWFHQKWGVPREAYLDSMNDCLAGARVPQWYLAMGGETIVGGCGVIENDFHDRPDLAPNVCAVYVEETYRCRGIAGELLHTVCVDMAEAGIRTLYLLTDHEGFYERYGWRYLCPALGFGEETPARMYVHRQPLVLHGAGPSPAQLLQADRRREPTAWLPAVVWTLSVILGLAAVGVAAYSGMEVQGTVWLSLLAALGFGIFAGCRAAARRREAQQKDWQCWQAAAAGGITTRLYPDRAEQRSSRWGETVPLDSGTRLTEFSDFLLLERGEQRIFLRGEDLTPGEGEEVLAILRAALPPQGQYRTAPFAGTRFASAPPPFAAASPLCFEQAAVTRLPETFDRLGTGAAALGISLEIAALLTALYTVTGFLFLDLAVFLAAAAAGAAGILWLFSRLLKRERPQPAFIAFTGEGLGVTAGGAHRFVVPAHITARRTGNGVRLSTPAGDFTLRWTDVKNRQQLEWMLLG